MSDLEKFLQQAAERMKERMREQQAGQNPPQRPVTVRQAERAAPRVEEPEILEAELIEPSPPRKSKGIERKRLSKIDQRKPPVSQNVDLADERMTQHLQEVFDHSLGQLGQKPAPTGNSNASAASDLTNKSSEVDRREQVTSPLIEVLRQPENLKAAFIVGEIFRRKF